MRCMGTPLSMDDPNDTRQKNHWDDQKCKHSETKTILIQANGVIETSICVASMKRRKAALVTNMKKSAPVALKSAIVTFNDYCTSKQKNSNSRQNQIGSNSLQSCSFS